MEPWWSNLKVGDVVTITKRIGSSGDYPLCFTEEMAELYSGKSFVIESIEPFNCEGRFYSNGDNHKYCLLDEPQFVWHSSMFEPNVVQAKEIKLSSIKFNF